MKERILSLRRDGLTYSEIVKEVGCSLSVVSYHCGPGQKEKNQRRQIKNRGIRDNEFPGIEKVERFGYAEQSRPKREKKSPNTIRDIRDKVRTFQRRQGSALLRAGKWKLLFTYLQLLETHGDNAVCYLTGRSIDLLDSSTYSLDHIVPASKGGNNTFENMGLTCVQANWAKSDMTVPQFLTLCRDVLTTFGCDVVGEPLIPDHMM